WPRVVFFSSRRRHTRFSRDWSSDVCSSDLKAPGVCMVVVLSVGVSSVCTLSLTRSGLDVNLHARLEEGHAGAALVGDPDVEGVAGADLGGLVAEDQVAVDGHAAGLGGGVDGGSDVCDVLAGDRGLHGSSLSLCVPSV